MRRRFHAAALGALVFFTAGAAGAGGTGSPAGALQPRVPAGAESRPPNVLILMTDDQRARGTMHVLPQTRRRLAGRGITFRRAFASLPLCCPSRATLLTGQYAHNHGVTHNNPGALDHTKTIQADLSAAGYHTAIFGKLLNRYSKNPPFFDRWMLFRGAKYWGARFNDQGVLRETTGYSTDVLRRRSVAHLKSLESDDDRPWMMLVSPYAPHHPYAPAARHRRAAVKRWKGNPAFFERDRRDKPPYVRERHTTFKAVRKTHRRQLRTLMSVDDLVARIDKTLKELRERRNTLVIFLSDNGFTWGDHGLLGLRYSKNTPYTASVRIPLIMRWPAVLEAGSSKRLVTNVDLAPTIYDVTEVQPGHEVDGRSVFNRRWPRKYVFLEHFANPPGDNIPTWASIRSKDHQYIQNYRSGTVKFREYYDLSKDPWQLVNLLHDGNPSNNPNVKADRRAVRRLRTCHGITGGNPCP